MENTFAPHNEIRKCYSREDVEAFNILRHPVWVFDIEQKAMWWANGAGLDLWSASSLGELLSRDFASDMSSSTESRLSNQLGQMKKGKVFKEQWTFYPQGKAKTLRTVCSVIYLDDNRAAMLVEAELPDHRDFDDALTRGIELLRHVPAPVCEFSEDGTKCLYRNPEDLRVFGDQPGRDTFAGRFVNREMAQTTLGQARDGKECRVDAEQYVSDGSTRWFVVSVRRAQDPVTGGVVLVQSARDISEIVKARHATMKANLKSEFLSVIAHELRSPIHQVVGYADMLELTSLSDFQLESVNLIQRSTESLMTIINDLLDMNRIENGNLDVAKVHFPLRGLLNACIATAEKDATLKGLPVKCNYSNLLPLDIVGDPNKLRQILLNLLGNAVKFTHQGHVSLNVYPLQVKDCSCTIRFEVVDTGIGIGQDEQKFVFDQYRQVNMAATREHGGTGLGLSICKNLTTALSGRIELKSELGKGSMFVVDLPFDLPATEDIRRQADRKLLIPVHGPLRILVVEDNKVNSKMVQRMLQKIGHHVLTAENGQLALDVLSEEAVDLVLMDVQMPVMDGIEATRQIRTRLKHSKQNLPVVGLTASFQHSDMRMYLDVGMNTCLSKPIRLDVLKKALDTVALRCAHGVYNE